MKVGTLHLLSDAEGGHWRVQVRHEAGQYETLLLSEGDLRKIRERTEKKPALILPTPIPRPPTFVEWFSGIFK